MQYLSYFLCLGVSKKKRKNVYTFLHSQFGATFSVFSSSMRFCSSEYLEKHFFDNFAFGIISYTYFPLASTQIICYTINTKRSNRPKWLASEVTKNATRRPRQEWRFYFRLLFLSI